MTASRLRAVFAIGVAFCFFAAVPLAAEAAAGELDSSFGVAASGIAGQSDGGVVAAGACKSPAFGSSDFCVGVLRASNDSTATAQARTRTLTSRSPARQPSGNPSRARDHQVGRAAGR